MSVAKALSNTQNNPRPLVDCYKTNVSTYSCADQDEVSDEISHSYDRTTSYPTDSVVFQGSKLCIGINLSPDGLKALPTPLNGSSSSVIISITTPFSFIHMEKNILQSKTVLNFNHQKRSLTV